MTTVGPDGQFTPGCKMETDEIAIHLRETLIEWGISPDEARKYTSHSMKATLLSWIAKAGGPMKARRMLGYHSKGTDKSTLVYSRDVMAWSLRHLGKTLRLVQKGMFDPDCTRSGYWTNQSDEMACDAFNLAHVA